MDKVEKYLEKFMWSEYTHDSDGKIYMTPIKLATLYGLDYQRIKIYVWKMNIINENA